MAFGTETRKKGPRKGGKEGVTQHGRRQWGGEGRGWGWLERVDERKRGTYIKLSTIKVF